MRAHIIVDRFTYRNQRASSGPLSALDRSRKQANTASTPMKHLASRPTARLESQKPKTLPTPSLRCCLCAADTVNALHCIRIGSAAIQKVVHTAEEQGVASLDLSSNHVDRAATGTKLKIDVPCVCGTKAFGLEQAATTLVAGSETSCIRSAGTFYASPARAQLLPLSPHIYFPKLQMCSVPSWLGLEGCPPSSSRTPG